MLSCDLIYSKPVLPIAKLVRGLCCPVEVQGERDVFLQPVIPYRPHGRSIVEGVREASLQRPGFVRLQTLE